MKRINIALIGGVVFLLAILVLFIGLRWGSQEGKPGETIREEYIRKEKAIMDKADMTEEEFKKELLELVSLARNELGHWREKENYWVVEVKPDYESYKIQKEEYEKLLRRIQIHVVEKLYSSHSQHERPYLVAKRLTQGIITETFDDLIRKDKGITEGFFKKI